MVFWDKLESADDFPEVRGSVGPERLSQFE